MHGYQPIEDIHAAITTFLADVPPTENNDVCVDEEGNEPDIMALRFELSTVEDIRAFADQLGTWGEANNLDFSVSRDERYVYVFH